jgi:hypothetical protein
MSVKLFEREVPTFIKESLNLLAIECGLLKVPLPFFIVEGILSFCLLPITDLIIDHVARKSDLWFKSLL